MVIIGPKNVVVPEEYEDCYGRFLISRAGRDMNGLLVRCRQAERGTELVVGKDREQGDFCLALEPFCLNCTNALDKMFRRIVFRYPILA